MDRYLAQQVREDLKQKAVFVAGPRQVGKTTMALSLWPDAEQGYLNWDIPEHREKILLNELPSTDFWIFDEIHKYSAWRNWLKGLIDRRDLKRKILESGRHAFNQMGSLPPGHPRARNGMLFFPR